MALIVFAPSLKNFSLPDFAININNPAGNNVNWNIPSPPQIVTQFVNYNAELDVSPNLICAGDTITGDLNTNIESGVCTVFVNAGTGWNPWQTVNLDASGDYTARGQVNNVGQFSIQAVCCDVSRNCKGTNTETLTVGMCAGNDSDGDGFSDDAESQAGTDPHDANDYPGSEDADTIYADCATGCINGAGYDGGYAMTGQYCYDGADSNTFLTFGGVYMNCCCYDIAAPPASCADNCDSMGYYGGYEVESTGECNQEITLASSYWDGSTNVNCCCYRQPQQTACFDSDGGGYAEVAGYCITPTQGTSFDSCISAYAVSEYQCTITAPNAVACIASPMTCPQGFDCSDGECVDFTPN